MCKHATALREVASPQRHFGLKWAVPIQLMALTNAIPTHSLPLAAQKKPCERGRSAKWHRHVQRWVLGRTALAPNGSDSTFHPAFGFKSTELPSQPPRQQGPWSPLLWKLINFEPARNSGFGGHSCMHACMHARPKCSNVS